MDSIHTKAAILGIVTAFSSLVLALPTKSLQHFMGQTTLSRQYFKFHSQALDKAEQENYRDVILDYTNALQVGEQLKFIDARTYTNRGLAHHKLQNYQAAIEDFDRSLELHPRRAHTYNNRGMARYKLGDKQGAIADYTQALHFDPNFSEAYSNRGIAFLRSGNIEDAIADLAYALNLDPYLIEAYYNRGNAYLKQGSYNEAIADYTQALKLNPDLALAYYNRGNARYGLGDRQAAIKNLRIAAQLFYKQGNEGNYQRTLNLLQKLQNSMVR